MKILTHKEMCERELSKTRRALRRLVEVKCKRAEEQDNLGYYAYCQGSIAAEQEALLFWEDAVKRQEVKEVINN